MDTTPSTVTTQTPLPSSEQPSLQDRIQTLTQVQNRLQTLRHVPTLLLRPPSGSPLAGFPPPFDPAIDREFAATFSSTPAHDFRALKDFAEVVSSDKVQEALRAARASEEADQSELGLCFRRETRKRKRPQSPVGSPQPYVPSPPRLLSLLPPLEDDPPPLRAESLVEFVREFNRGNGGGIKSEPTSETDGASPKCKLAIWSRTQSSRKTLQTSLSQSHVRGASPVVVRFIVPDVLTAYISLTHTNTESALTVESVTAFGPRERKLPHEQSDYLAYQGLTRHITKMILTHPRVSVQILMNVLVSYRGLFVDRCTNCQRVLSAEGHIPPVARVWVPKETEAIPSGESKVKDGEGTSGSGQESGGAGTDHGSGRWEARHATCVYN